MRWHEEALTALDGHAWPGNVRELLMLVRRVAVLVERDVVCVEDLSAAGLRAPQAALERDALLEALAASGGNLSRTARALRIPRSTLADRLKRT